MVLHQINVYILYFVGFLVLLGNTAPVFEDSGPLVFDLIRIRGANDSYGKRDDTPVVLEQLLQQLGRFGIKIILKGRSYILHLDSGTPSTWIAQEDFQCYDKSKHPQSQDYCKLGPGLAPSLSEGGFQALGYFKESYGDGEHATGQWIRETAEIGGLRVNDVLIALIDELFWEGDGLTVGLFGMSWYPGISSVWQVLCSSWGLPVQFTLAINRGYEGNNGGSIAIGGILDGEPVTPDSWETVPLSGQKGWFIEGFELQTIKIDKSTLVDSGAPFIDLPQEAFDEFLALWDPFPISHNGRWYVANKAKGPETLDFKIGQATFKIPVKDNILIWNSPSYSYAMVKPFLPRPGHAATLGVPFMSHVIINHNLDGRKMSFKQRVYTEVLECQE